MLKAHLIRIVVLIVLLPFFGMAQYSGVVFFDDNRNGRHDSGEVGLAGIRVTNGEQVVATATDGTFTLPESERARFIYLTTPSGYACDSFYLPNRGKYFDYHFPLRKSIVPDTFSFLHISDTETWDSTQWVAMLRDYARFNQSAFLIHTGDICYEKGMRFHDRYVNTQTMGLPVYYTVGNHDLVAGPYGEALYEDLFGPVYYSFDVGNTHFIVTPMLGGDFKPSYTKKDVYTWLKNDLKHVSEEQTIIAFHHDLLREKEGFVYRLNDQEKINLEELGLKAWVYGHWHNHIYQPHPNSEVVSICTAPPNKGGIDHSVAAFRVFDVYRDGTFSTELIYAYVDHQLAIASPAPAAVKNADDEITLHVNAYNSTSALEQVSYQLDRGTEGSLKQVGPWSWQKQLKVPTSKNEQDSLLVSVTGTFGDGTIISQRKPFLVLDPDTRRSKAGDWPGFLLNSAHRPEALMADLPPLVLEWVAATGGVAYHASPVVGNGKVFLASVDEGDVRNCAITAIDFTTGTSIWRFSTHNAVKHAMAYWEGIVLAADVEGYVYAIQAESGSLLWKIHLDDGVLPTYVGGVTVKDGVVYTGDGYAFSALRIRDGKVMWTNERWPTSMGAPAPPTIGAGVVVASSNWKHLYAFNESTGQPLWSQAEEGLRFRNASPVFYEGYFYTSAQKSLHKIDPSNGKILFSKELPYSMQAASSPAFWNDLLVIGTADAGLRAFRRHDFEEVWSFMPQGALTASVPYEGPNRLGIAASPVVANDKVYLGAPDGYLYVLDASTGEVLWATEIGAPIYSAVALSGGYIIVSDFGGNVYVFSGVQH